MFISVSEGDSVSGIELSLFDHFFGDESQTLLVGIYQTVH